MECITWKNILIFEHICVEETQMKEEKVLNCIVFNDTNFLIYLIKNKRKNTRRTKK